MGVTVKNEDAAKGKQEEAQAAAPARIELVLARAKRLNLGNKLYTAGVRYAFDQATALDLLGRVDSNGDREWATPTKVALPTQEAVEAKVNGPVEVVTAEVPPAPEVTDADDQTAVEGAAKKGIEIMDEGEAV
jgi:hypothetical protein